MHFEQCESICSFLSLPCNNIKEVLAEDETIKIITIVSKCNLLKNFHILNNSQAHFVKINNLLCLISIIMLANDLRSVENCKFFKKKSK